MNLRKWSGQSADQVRHGFSGSSPNTFKGSAAMLTRNMPTLWLLWAIVASIVVPASVAPAANVMAIAHTYEVRIRLDGRVTTVRVEASDAGHAKKLVRAQFGDKVTVLSAKRVD
jgi:hypothetical protein